MSLFTTTLLYIYVTKAIYIYRSFSIIRKVHVNSCKVEIIILNSQVNYILKINEEETSKK